MKLNLNNITSGFASNTLLNANFDAIETAIENTVSRDGTNPNYMAADLDMNGYRILNCADIISDGSLTAKGEWTPSTGYVVGDLVNVGTQTYIAVVDHTSSSTFGDDSASWQELFISYISQSGGSGGSGLPAYPDPATGDGSGWVVYTDGITSGWVPASSLPDTALPTFAVHSFTATGGETTITLPFAYTIGGKNLIVMVQGLTQYPSDHYTEDTATTFTFLSPLEAGDKVRIIANIISSAYVPTQAALAALYALTPAANKFPYFTSGTAAALGDISAFVRSITGSADAAAFLTAIGAASSASVSGFGVGQTWQNVKASRAVNTSYQNTTGKPIMVNVQYVSGSGSLQVSINNSAWVVVANSADGGDERGPVSAIIPDGHYYKAVFSGGSINYWAELR